MSSAPGVSVLARHQQRPRYMVERVLSLSVTVRTRDISGSTVGGCFGDVVGTCPNIAQVLAGDV
jgi:hypothetical protein